LCIAFYYYLCRFKGEIYPLIVVENAVADEQRLATLMSSSGRISYSPSTFLRFWEPKFCTNHEKDQVQDLLRVFSKDMQNLLSAHKSALKEHTTRIIGRKGFIYEEDLVNAMLSEEQNSVELAFAVHKFLFEGRDHWIKDSQWALSGNRAGPYIPRPQWQMELLSEARNAMKSIDLESFKERVKSAKPGGFRCLNRGDELILNCLRLYADDFYVNAGNALVKNPFKDIVSEAFLGVAIIDSQSQARALLNRLLGPSNGTIFAIDNLSSKPLMNSYISSNSDLLSEDSAVPTRSDCSDFGVVDFGDLQVLLIDPEGTVEVDDGISCEEIPGRPEEVALHVHVANPSGFIDDAIEGEACRRAGSLYLPEFKVPMLPSNIIKSSTLKLSDSERSCVVSTLTFSCRVDLRSGNVYDHQIRRGLIKNLKHMTYEQADSLENDPQIELIKRVFRAHLKFREAKGHVNVSFPRATPHLDREKRKISIISSVEHSSVMREAVAEAMIIAGRVAGEYMCERSILGPFRNHPGFTQPCDHGSPMTLLQKYKLIKTLPNASIDCVARPHVSMGLDAYVKVTSPLRRYLDLVSHAILLKGEVNASSKYGKEWFHRHLGPIHRQELYNKRLSSAVNRFWIEKFLWQEGADKVWTLVPLERIKNDSTGSLWTVHVEQVATNFICQLNNVAKSQNDNNDLIGSPINARLIGSSSDSLLTFERM
jgi:hypothetical protein